MQYLFSSLNSWFIANRLCINLDKTNIMIFPSNKKENITVSFNWKSVTKVSSCRYLGLQIDEDLNWKTHIEYIYNKLIRFVGILYKMRNKKPSRILKSIYFAFVHPHLLYGIEVYANTGSTHLNKLETLNNKLLRILQNKPYNYPTRDLYVEYNTLSIPD